MILGKEKNPQSALSLGICALLFYQPLTFCINVVLNLFVGEGFIYDTLVCYFILLVILIRAFWVTSKNIKKDTLFLLLFFLIAYLFTYLLFPQNRGAMFTSLTDVMGNPLYILFIFAMGGYIFTRHIENYDLLIDYLTKGSFIIVICSIATFFIMINNESRPQYMVFSYNMLLPTILLFILSFEKKDIFMLLTGIAGCFIIFIAGARGPVVCILITLCIYVLLRKTKPYKKIGSILLLLLLVFAVLFFFNDILLFVKKVIDGWGFDSRTIDLILNGDVFDDSGRGDIKKNVINSFTLFGSGLYGDRITSGSSYAHHIVLELLAQWGYLFGTFFIGAIFIIVLKGILSKNVNVRNLSIIFLSSGLIKLFLSGSYLNQETAFWILLALGMNALYISKPASNTQPKFLK